MNDEYLWQKTGEDPEIKRMEDALAVFRYNESKPPAIATAVKTETSRRWRFGFAYAVAAFAAVTLAIGMWFRMDRVTEVTFIHVPASETTEQPKQPSAPIIQPPAAPSQPARRTREQIRPVIASAVRQKYLRRPAKRTPTLTKEEQYAYNQLLLALSISSSKISIARNAINGVDEPTPKPNNR